MSKFTDTIFDNKKESLNQNHDTIILEKNRKVVIYLTHSDYTKEILNIKDENIHFDENCLEMLLSSLIDFTLYFKLGMH